MKWLWQLMLLYAVAMAFTRQGETTRKLSGCSHTVFGGGLCLGAIRNLRPLSPEAVEGPSKSQDEMEREIIARLETNQRKQLFGKKTKLQTEMLPPTFEDMKKMAFLLANVSDSLDSRPEVALSVASQNFGWLLDRNVPDLIQMLLIEYPALRQDQGLMRGYMFLMDFLEAITKETGNLLKKNQAALKTLLEAMKISEAAIDEVIETNSVLKSPEFLVYLDSEIQSQEPNGPMENLLVTIKLRVLEEVGKGLGYDTTVLPKLAAEEDPAELRRKTIEHLQSYEGVGGKELFLQALRLMMKEMKKRHVAVDPLLIANLKEVEKITQDLVKREIDKEDSQERII